MPTSARLMTWLDRRFLLDQGATIGLPLDEGPQPPIRSGAEIARELRGRKLLRYVREAQLGEARHGVSGMSYATLTPFAPDDTIAWLVLPAGSEPRRFAIILEPVLIPAIQGPLLVAGASGIQYILVDGFPPDAVIVPGAPGAHWEVVVD